MEESIPVFLKVELLKKRRKKTEKPNSSSDWWKDASITCHVYCSTLPANIKMHFAWNFDVSHIV